MDSEKTRNQQYVQILRLLFKYDLVPKSTEDEVKFIRELTDILKL